MTKIDSKGRSLEERLVTHDGDLLIEQLDSWRKRQSPSPQKLLRNFGPKEAATLIGVSDSSIRHQVIPEGATKPARLSQARRSFTLQQIHDLRRVFERNGRFRHLPERRGAEHLQVLSVVNPKSDSGKTTLAAHLAQYLAMRGYRVLVVDLDQKGRLSQIFGFPGTFGTKSAKTLASVLQENTEVPLAVPTKSSFFNGVDVLPADLGTWRLGQTSSADTTLSSRLSAVLANVDERYDVAVVDCPSDFNGLTKAALRVATSVLVTITPTEADVVQSAQLMGMMSEVWSPDGAKPQAKDFIRYLVARYDAGSALQGQLIGLLRSVVGTRALTAEMPESLAISDAWVNRSTLYEDNGGGVRRNVHNSALEAMDAINAEVRALIDGAWGR